MRSLKGTMFPFIVFFIQLYQNCQSILDREMLATHYLSFFFFNTNTHIGWYSSGSFQIQVGYKWFRGICFQNSIFHLNFQQIICICSRVLERVFLI